MLHASTQKLILKLAELTEAGAIAWKEGDSAPPCSVFETEGYFIEVAADPPTVRLLQADGREIERADAADLAETAWPEGEGTFATHVAAMAERAHRVARGAEAAISRILSSLSAPPQRPAEPEPSPAAPEFDATPAVPPQAVVRAVESVAALAAVSADVESMRRSAPAFSQPLPQSHAAPEPPPLRSESASPTPQPAPELTRRIDPPPVVRPAPPSPRRANMFGATRSFSQAKPPQPALAPVAQSAQQAVPAKVTSGGLVFPRISAVTRQTVHGEAAPAPQVANPGPAPTASVEAPPSPSGPDVYKPWA
jgi:hypothetical protein